jgi:hypothetical protein
MKRKGTHDWWPEPIQPVLEPRKARELAKMARFSASYSTGRMTFPDPPLQNIPISRQSSRYRDNWESVFGNKPDTITMPFNPGIVPGARIRVGREEFIVENTVMMAHDEIQIEVRPAPIFAKASFDALEKFMADEALGLGLENNGWKTKKET